MTTGLLAFLLGLFGVPLVLLAWGHRLRKRGPRARAAFWGAVAGHCIAGTLALVFAMVPPEAWAPDNVVRGFFGLWALLVLPLLGAGVTGMFTRLPS